VVWTQVSGDYFRAMAIPCLKADTSRHRMGRISQWNTIKSRRRYWPGEDPSATFEGFDPRGRNDEWVTVVGSSGYAQSWS